MTVVTAIQQKILTSSTTSRGIGICTRYRYRCRSEVSVSEVSVHSGIGLSLIIILTLTLTLYGHWSVVHGHVTYIPGLEIVIHVRLPHPYPRV